MFGFESIAAVPKNAATAESDPERTSSRMCPFRSFQLGDTMLLLSLEADVRRREFLMSVASSAALWPHAASAQQPGRVRRIGVLMHSTSDEPESQTRIAVLHQGLQASGWTV